MNKYRLQWLFTVAFALSMAFNVNAQYCVSGGPGDPADSNVESVLLVGETSTITHTGCPGVLGVEDLTSLSADLIAGNSYSLDILFGTCGSNFGGAGAAWIDWDQSGSFEASEQIVTSAGTPGSPPWDAVVSTSFTVPGTTSNGTTRMRVMQAEAGTNPLDPCGSFTWGSVMDFSVSTSGGCPATQNLAVDNVTDVSVDVVWTDNPSTTFTVDVKESGISLAGYPVSGVTGGSYPVSGLTIDTEYSVVVTPACGPAGAVEILFSTLSCLPGDRCSYTLTCRDFGDAGGITFNGWTSGAVVQVTAGNVVSTYNVPPATYGGQTEFDFTILSCPGDLLTVELIGTLDAGEGWSLSGPGGLDYTPADPSASLSIVSCPTCAPANGASASNVCDTGVDLAWINGAAYDSVRVRWSYFVPPFFTFEGSDTLRAGIDLDLESYSFTGQAWPLNTSITYDIIGYCPDTGSGAEQSQISGTFTTPSCPCADQCTYQITYFDSFGDGWEDGGTLGSTNISVFLDGGLVATVNPPTSGTGVNTYQLSTCPGSDISFDLVDGPSGTDSEIRFKIENLTSGQVFVDFLAGNGGLSGNQTVYTGLTCPSCIAPTDLAAIDITGDEARIVWNDLTGENLADYTVVPTGDDPLTGTWAQVADTTFLATGLLGNTSYTAYVSSVCTAGSSDTLSVTFSTLAGCGDTGITFCYPNGTNGVVVPITSYSAAPGEWIEISINSGSFESCCDTYFAYSDVVGGTLIYSNTGDLSGQSIISTTGTIALAYEADGSVSCGSGSNTPLNYDILCYPAPACFEVLSLNVDSVSFDAIRIAFNDTMAVGTNLYDIEITNITAGTPADTVFGVAGSPYLATGLDGSSQYSFRVRTDCNASSDGFSDFAGPVNATTLPTCPVPDTFILSGLGENTFTVSWNAPAYGGTTYTIEVADTTGYAGPGTGDVTTGYASTSFTASGLNPSTTYFFFINTECTSLNSDTLGFFVTTTQAAPPTPDGVTCSTPGALPSYVFTEEFASGNPNGWTGNIGTANGTWRFGTAGNANSGGTGPAVSFSGGTHLEYESSGTTTGSAAAVSPVIDLSDQVDDVEASFYFHVFGINNNFGQFDFQVTNDAGATWDTLFTWTGAYQVFDTDPWLPVGVDLSAYVGQVIQLRLSATDGVTGFQGDFAVDLLRIESCGTGCLDPFDQTATNLTSDGGDLGWTAAGIETSWDLHIVLAADPAPAEADPGNTPDVATNPYEFTGAAANTAYKFYVRADCGAADTSAWVGPFNFSTPCAVEVPDYSSGIDVFLPACWNEAANGDLTTGPTGLGTGSWSGSTILGSGSAKRNLFNANSPTAWLVTPEFDLSAGGYEVVVDVAVTDWNGSAPDAMGSDDSVQLVYTEDGVTWNIVYTWTVADALPNAPTQFAFPLVSTGSSVRFGIRSNDGPVNDPEDYDFHVDRFQVRTPPVCLEPTALTATGIDFTSADLGWTNGDTETVWDLYVGPGGGAAPDNADPGNYPDVTTNPYNWTDGAAGSSYDFYVRAQCGLNDTSAWVGPLTFSTASISDNFCAAGPTSPVDSNVDQVSISGEGGSLISYTAVCPGILGVQDLTAESVDLIAGSTYTLDVTFATCGGNFGGAGEAWIDFDASNSHEPVESLGSSTGTPGTAPWDAPVTFSFTVPVDAVNGARVMRVMQRESGTPPLDPCGTYSWGSVIDFTVNISGGVTITCPAPNLFAASNETAVGADLSWSPSGAETTWDLHIVPSGAPAPLDTDPGNVPDVSTEPYVYTGGTQATAYDAYLRADCGPGDVSTWVGPISFTTLCGVEVPYYNTGFDTFLPLCWDEATSGSIATGPTGLGSGNWASTTVLGSGSARVNLSATTSSEWLLSPDFDLSGGTYEAVVDVAVTNTFASTPDLMGSDDKVTLLYTEDGTTWNTIYVWTAADALSTAPTQFILPLSSTAANVQFGILATDGPVDDIESYWFHVDRFQVRIPPTCPEPTAFTADPFSTTDVDLDWEAGGAETSWILEYGTSPVQGDPENTTVVVPPDSQISLSGLTEGTTYFAWLIGDCGPGDQSIPVSLSWSQPLAGSTCEIPIEITSLPFSLDDVNTALYGDDYSTSPCSNVYMGGDDVVFRYTPDADGCINMDFNMQGTWGGIHILSDCPTAAGVTCLVPDGVGPGHNDLFASGTGARFVDGFEVTAGEDYYIIVSTFPAPQSIVFDIAIDNCPPPPANDECAGAQPITVGTGVDCSGAVAGTLISATQSATPALGGCATQTNGYNDVWYVTTVPASGRVRIDFPTKPGANMFSELYIGADCGSLTPVPLSCSAISPKMFPVQGGPAASALPAGATLYIRVWDAFNDNLGDFTICVTDPVPANNNCATAQSVTPGEFGTPSWISGTTYGAYGEGGCFGGGTEQVWYSFVATDATQVVLARPVSGNGYNAVIEVKSACDGFVQLLGCFNNYGAGAIERALLTGLTKGNTYYYSVYNLAGIGTATSSAFETQVSGFHQDHTLRANSCNVSGLTLDQTLYSERDNEGELYANPAVPVTGYSYRFVGGGLDVIVDRNTVDGYFLSLEDVAGLQYNTSYDVTVRHRVNVPGNGTIDAYWSDFGPVCTVALGDAPTTTLRPEFCEAASDYLLGDQIFAVTLAGATDYRFNFTPSGGGTTISEVSPNYAVILQSVGPSGGPGLQYGISYDVTVDALVGGVWISGVDVCTIFMASQPEDTNVRAQYCPSVRLYPSSQVILAEVVNGGVYYEWQFTPIGGGAALSKVTPSYSFNFGAASLPFMPGTTYNVQVRAFAGGVLGDYNDIGCQVTIQPAPSMEGVGGDVMVFDNKALSASAVADLYPNPNSGENLFISLTEMEDEYQSVVVEVVDLAGKVVHQEQVASSGKSTNFVITFNERLAKGMYFVNLYLDDTRLTEKLSVE